eukprot:1156248-Pelagomonas_calceolata.AAC.6
MLHDRARTSEPLDGMFGLTKGLSWQWLIWYPWMRNRWKALPTHIHSNSHPRIMATHLRSHSHPRAMSICNQFQLYFSLLYLHSHSPQTMSLATDLAFTSACCHTLAYCTSTPTALEPICLHPIEPIL